MNETSSDSSDEEWSRPDSATKDRDGYLFSQESYSRRQQQRIDEEQRAKQNAARLKRQRELDTLNAPAIAPCSPKFTMPPPLASSSIKSLNLSRRPPVFSIPEVMSSTTSATTLWRAIWRKNSKVKTKLPIPDTIFIDSNGNPSRWLFTSIKGTVLKKSSSNATWNMVYRVFEKKYNNQQRTIPRPNLSTPVACAWYRTSEIPKFLSMSDLSKLCEIESGESTVVQAHQLKGFQARTNVIRIQFHMIGRVGTPIVYENTYTMSDVNGAHPVLSTDRIRGDEHNVENRSPKNKTNRNNRNNNMTTTNMTNTFGGIKSISLQVNQSRSCRSETDPTLDKTNRIPSQDRHLNQRLSDMTKYLASMVEGRSRNTLSVRRLVIQYTIDTHGVAFYTETTELVVVSTKKNRKLNIPQAIRFPAPNRTTTKVAPQNGSVSSTADQRHVDFHRKSKRRNITNAQDVVSNVVNTTGENNYQDMDKKNGLLISSMGTAVNGNSTLLSSASSSSSFSAIALSKANCNGDFCHFYQDIENAKLEKVEKENQKDYVPWKANDAKKSEWKQLQDDKEAGMEDTESKEYNDVSSANTNTTLVVSATSTKSFKQQNRNSPSSSKLLLPYRSIADARSIGLRHMPVNMLRWHVTKRAKRRRGQGPWVSVSIPEMNMGSSLSYTPGQPVLTVWEWAGSIKYVRVQLFRGWDSACDIQVGTKNDGVLDWNVPTLYALRMARQAMPTSFDMKEEESKNEFEKKESKNDQNGEDVNADDEEQKNDDMFDENTPQPRGPVWRIKISDTNNPQIYAYSGRFCIDFFTHSESINPNEKGDRGNRGDGRDGRRGRTSAMTSIDDRKLQRELEIEEQQCFGFKLKITIN